MQSRKASSNPAPPPALAGQVSRISIGDMLASLEVRGRSAVVRFEGNGPADSATVWLADGRLVDAEAGELSGEPAVYRILGLTHGRFEVSHEPVDRPDVIGEPVAALVRKRSKRAARWQDLLLGGSGLNAVPELSGGSLSDLDPEDAKLLQLIDGRKSLLEVLDESRLDPVIALETLRRLEGEGHFSIRRSSSGPPRPDPQRDRVSPIPTRTSTLIGVQAVSEVPPSDKALSSTLIGGPESAWREVRPAVPPSGTPAPDESGVSASQIRGGVRTSWPSLEFSQEPPTASDEFDRRSFPPGSPRSLSPGPATPGATLGAYEVLFRLAHGATSSVYLCREAGLGSVRSLFALKSFELQGADAGEFCQRVQRMASLRQPNLVSVIDAFTARDRTLIVSDYVEGTSLAALMKRQPSSRPPALVVAVLFDALRGLRAAHEAPTGGPFVHGGLSPRDLLLGVEGVCRVADVGASAALRATQGLEPPNEPYRISYCAPERLLGRGVDQRSDVFSIGVCLYEALTGTELFRAATAAETRRNVLEKAVRPPSEVGLCPPRAFDAVCLRALNRDPEQRFEAIAEFLIELESAALDHDTLASSADVAAWVGSVFGRDFELRRLSILDASRRSRIGRPSSAAAGASEVREQGSLPPAVETESSQVHAVHPKPRATPEFDAARSTRDSSPVLAIAELPTEPNGFDLDDDAPFELVTTKPSASGWLLAVAVVLVLVAGTAWWLLRSKPAAEVAPPVQQTPVVTAAPPPTVEVAPVPPPPAPTEAAAPDPASPAGSTPPAVEASGSPAQSEKSPASNAQPRVVRKVAPRAPRPVAEPPPADAAPPPAEPAPPPPPEEEAPPPPPPAPPPTSKSDSDFSYGI